jgi:glycosyltransferase involved in cell wall biosynthesis
VNETANNVQISGVVTTFNSAATIARCLASLKSVCGELIVLDSGSTDGTKALCDGFGALFFTQAFAGYSAQKTAALALACHEWVVLLDSDEALDPTAQQAIRHAIHAHTTHSGFRLPRRELIFWRYQHLRSKHNRFLRVFMRSKAHISPQLVHESVQTDGLIADLNGCIVHDGDISIEHKLTKLNRYSSLAAATKKPMRGSYALRLTLYPAWYFLRIYLIRRQFLNGWAGYINSVELAHYAFLKYAKVFERGQKKEGL